MAEAKKLLDELIVPLVANVFNKLRLTMQIDDMVETQMNLLISAKGKKSLSELIWAKLRNNTELQTQIQQIIVSESKHLRKKN